MRLNIGRVNGIPTQMSRRLCSEGCTWCKEWKKAQQLISVAVQTEISISKTKKLAEEEADSTQVEKSDAEPSSATGEYCQEP